MRIGIGVHAPTSASMEVGTIDMALALLGSGHDVTLFAEHDVELPDRAEPLADRVVRLPAPRRQLSPRARDALFVIGRLELSRRWARALHDAPVDVVHAHSPGTAALLPRSVAVVAQAWWHPSRATLRGRLFGGGAYGAGAFAGDSPINAAVGFAANVARHSQVQVVDRAGFRRADVLAASTREAVRWLEQHGHRAVWVPPVAAVLDAPPQRAPASATRVAFCAHPLDRPWKGLSYLLDALPRVTGGELEVTLVGGWGDGEDPGVAAAKRAGVTVETLGRVPRERYLEHLERATDVLAAPALWEEWGYTLFEGLGRGVPAIAFDLYPYGELLDDRFGRVVAARDVDAFAVALSDACAGRLPSPGEVLEATRAAFGPAASAERAVAAYELAVAR